MTQQLILGLVLATMVFSISLELKISDFKGVVANPKGVFIGLIPQFILLPIGTWAATLILDLPPNIEAAMILVACCPGGSLSNFVTHYGRGNTALSLSISAVASILALVLTPFNFAWMIAANPATAAWIKTLAINAKDIWVTLFFLLALPLALGLFVVHKYEAFAEKIRKPLARFALIALFVFIIGGLYKERSTLTLALLPTFFIAILHNAFGLALGWLTCLITKINERDSRAIIIEGGMQNSGLALGIILLQFNNDFGMVALASFWGIWHIVSGMTMAVTWRRKDAKARIRRL